MLGLFRRTVPAGMVLAAFCVAPAVERQADDPLVTLLKTAGMTYTDIGGFVKMRYTIASTTRGQDVFIRKAPFDYLSLKVWECYAIVLETPLPVPSNVLNDLFTKRYGIGSLIYELASKDQKFYRVRFRIDVPTNSTTAELKTLCGLVAATGDSIEKSIHADDFDRL